MNTEEYACMRAVEDNHWWYKGLHALVRDAVERFGTQGSHLIDVGCGTGGMAVQLASSHRITGLDISPEGLQFCRERGIGALARADAGYVPLADDSADIALLLDVLYHSMVGNRAGVLAEIRRILRPGGVVVINVPAYQWLYSSHDVAVHTAHRFTRSEINRLLTDAGFEIVSSTYWNSILLPAIATCRFVLRWLPDRGSDLDPNTPDWINRVLGTLLSLERWCMKRTSLPAGVSIFVVARVPDS